MEVTRVSEVVEYARLLGILAGALAFMILLAVDILHAFRKKDFWVPGRTLILSVLTLQIMGFIESQSDVVNEMLDGAEPSPEYVKNCLFMIHTSRVMLCLLVALFLPEMASPDNQEKWTKIAALGITIFADIFTQVYGVNSRFSKSAVHVIYKWFFISGTIISITLLWLIVLLICSATASKSIREITTQKIPIILAEPAENSWIGVEDQVLKSLIVGRPFYPETIILNSPAAMGVTVCIISSLLGWVVVGPKVKIFPSTAFRLVFIISILQVIFILIGWAVVSWRLLISIAFYGRRRRDREHIRHFFLIEDFWTRQIVQLQGAEELKLTKLKYDESVIKMFVTKPRNPRVDDRLTMMIVKEKKKRKGLVWILLHCLILLQRCVVFFSKVCWFFSDLIFCNRIIRKIVSVIFSKQRRKMEEEFERYAAIWDSIEYITGQSPYTLFVTNRKAIKQAKSIMKKGNEIGENCHTLIPFLKNRRSETCISILDLDPDKQAEKNLKFLWRHYPVPPLEVERYFKYASKLSWKLTAVSLISIIVRLSPRCGRDSLQAYYEAWELIDLVEESDPATDSLLSKAADRLFTSVRDESENVAPTTTEKARDQSENAAPTTMEKAAKAINDLARKSAENADAIREKIVKGEDTMEDWEKLAACNAVYMLSRSIGNFGDLRELLDELESSLAIIISSCMKKVGPALVRITRNWAQSLDKIKLLEAVYIAGKSRALMEKLERDSNVTSKTEACHQGWRKNVVHNPATEESSMV